MYGTVAGTVTGNSVSFTIEWIQQPGNPVGVYTGVIDDNGRVAGTTVDRNNPANKATWSFTKAECIVTRTPGGTVDALAAAAARAGATIAPPPAMTAPPATGQKAMGKANIVTAKNDVDVYNSPVQPRRVTTMMRRGTQAVSTENHRDGWCKLFYPPVGATVTGWVAMDHLSGTCKGQ
jgi:hypothetical protein